MFNSIELPIWLFALICALGIIGLFDRFFLPSYRWMMRERFNRKIDTLNSRLKLRIQPFKLTKRESLIDRILFDKDILSAIESESKAKNIPRGILMDRVKVYAKEIVPNFNATTYFRIGTAGAKFISQALYRVRLGYTDDNALKNIDPDATVIFVINHRSNMDYVLVTYLASASSALSYAVGEWAQVVFLRTLIKSMGAYFIRRNSNDPLYRKVLGRYVSMATQEGVTQAVFPEGGLTRDGLIQPAKLGLISYMVAKFSLQDERDIVFIPVGINYDRVIEDRNLTMRIAKDEGIMLKTKGNAAVFSYFFKALKRRLTGKWYRLGYASVSFGEPLSLKDYSYEHRLDFKALGEEQRFKAVETLGKTLMEEISKIVPVLPVSLVTRALLKAETPLDTLALKVEIEGMITHLKAKSVHIHIPRQEIDYAIETGIRTLVMRHLIEDKEGIYSVIEKEKHILSFYANSIEHYFK